MSVAILIVEDDAPVGRSLQLLCELEGVAAAWVDSAEAARAACRASGADFRVLLVDHLLPDGTGLDLLFELAPLQPAAALVLFSGLDRQEFAADPRTRELHALLAKPISREQLRALFAQVL